MMNEIICPVDFSDNSIAAMEFASAIAEAHNSKLRLVHVITPEEYNDELGMGDEDAMSELSQNSEQKLAALCEKINAQIITKSELCTYQVISGSFVKQLEELVASRSASMIVMGTHGANSVPRAAMGSHTVKLVNQLHIPVLAIPTNCSFNGLDRVLYASEFEESDNEFLQSLIDFVFPFDSRIYVVNISDDQSGSGKALEYAEDLKTYFPNSKISVERETSSDKITIALEHSLNKYDAQMLVMIHKTRSGLGKIFSDSITKEMSYMTNFPLLVFRN